MDPDLEHQMAAPSQDLQYETETRPGAMILSCYGSFSLPNHRVLDEIYRVVVRAGEPRVIMDLLEVDFIDSVGIGTMAMILKHVMANHIRLIVVPSEIVTRTLAMASLDKVLVCVPNVEEALKV